MKVQVWLHKNEVKDFFSKYDQIRSFLWIWLHLLKKSLIENFIFCMIHDAVVLWVTTLTATTSPNNLVFTHKFKLTGLNPMMHQSYWFILLRTLVFPSLFRFTWNSFLHELVIYKIYWSYYRTSPPPLTYIYISGHKRSTISRVLKSHRSNMGAVHMQSWKQCALPLITTMALWQLMHLGTWYTVYIYIHKLYVYIYTINGH